MFAFCSQEHIEILVGKDGWPAFFQQRDSPYYPTLRVVHQCEFIICVDTVFFTVVKMICIF